MALRDQANALVRRLPLRFILPAGGALIAVLLLVALVGPSLVGSEQTGSGGPAPNASAAGPLNSTTTSTLQASCKMWTRDWRDHCESLEAVVAETSVSATTAGAISTTTLPPPSTITITSTTSSLTPVLQGPALSSDWVPVVAAASQAVVMVEESGFTGSGFLIDRKGHVVTNRHVVEDGPPYHIRTTGGRRFPAKLVGMSRRYDIAVLRVSRWRGTPLKWGPKPKVGQGVLALGFPGAPALEKAVFSAAQGIISGFGRDVPGDPLHQNMVQYDIPTNHGNSGGPVLNSDGRVIAVVAAGEPLVVPDPDSDTGVGSGRQGMDYGVLGTDAQKTVKKLLS